MLNCRNWNDKNQTDIQENIKESMKIVINRFR